MEAFRSLVCRFDVPGSICRLPFDNHVKAEPQIKLPLQVLLGSGDERRQKWPAIS